MFLSLFIKRILKVQWWKNQILSCIVMFIKMLKCKIYCKNAMKSRMMISLSYFFLLVVLTYVEIYSRCFDSRIRERMFYRNQIMTLRTQLNRCFTSSQTETSMHYTVFSYRFLRQPCKFLSRQWNLSYDKD